MFMIVDNRKYYSHNFIKECVAILIGLSRNDAVSCGNRKLY